jgi:N utilization substance protein A
MAPAEVQSIVVDEEAHSMDIAVEDGQLSQAIGRNGQNVRLASQLTGWELNVMSASEATEKAESEMGVLVQSFMDKLDVDEDVATILVQEGFSSIEEVAYVPEQEMNDIEEFDEDIVAELRSRARDVLLTQAIASEEKLETSESASVTEMEEVSDELAAVLAQNEVATQDDLAELAVDELVEMAGLSEEDAAALIMKARESWFAEENTETGE